MCGGTTEVVSDVRYSPGWCLYQLFVTVLLWCCSVSRLAENGNSNSSGCAKRWLDQIHAPAPTPDARATATAGRGGGAGDRGGGRRGRGRGRGLLDFWLQPDDESNSDRRPGGREIFKQTDRDCALQTLNCLAQREIFSAVLVQDFRSSGFGDWNSQVPGGIQMQGGGFHVDPLMAGPWALANALVPRQYLHARAMKLSSGSRRASATGAGRRAAGRGRAELASLVSGPLVGAWQLARVALAPRI
jgi:hypothetical protein